MADKLEQLKGSVDHSAQLIGCQLQSIDSSLLGAFASLAMSIGVSNILGMLVYWIPASLFLMLGVLGNSFVRSYILTPIQRRKKEQKDVNLPTMPLWYGLLIAFKNSVPLFKTISVIFFVPFVALVLKAIGRLEGAPNFSVVVPLIPCLFFISVTLLVNKVINRLERIKTLDLRIGCLNVLLILFFLLSVAFITFPLSIWSLVILSPIYANSAALLSMLLVVFLQIITALIFMNYFSASSVKKEMTVALRNLLNIHFQIDTLLLSNSVVSDAKYNELLEIYFEATRYQISADDALLINFYSLVPTPTYLSQLDKKK